MSRHIALFTTFVFLSSCAYLADGALQDLRIETPGAQGAICSVFVDKIRYTYNPPQTIKISKSKNDLIIDCAAPGNRRQKLVIAPQVDNRVSRNLLNPGGYAWDYATEAMFHYPRVVRVDFRKMPAKGENLPAQNNPDIPPPESYSLEEFLPNRPKLNSDANEAPFELRRRASSTEDDLGPYIDDFSATTESAPGKGDVMDVIERLNPSSDNGVMDGQVETPTSLTPEFPGE